MVNTKRPLKICKKISLNHSRHSLGKELSEEHKKKISESRKGKGCGEKNPLYWLNKKGDKSAHWKGGKVIRKNGEILIFSPNHPFTPKNKKYIIESRLIAEKILNRYLTRKEIIHHIDFNKSNNSPNNLYLFPSQSKHTKFHHLLRKNPNIILKSNLH